MNGWLDHVRRSFVGKPDGHLIRLRCSLLGHRWLYCAEACCNGETQWCARCDAPRAAIDCCAQPEPFDA